MDGSGVGARRRVHHRTAAPRAARNRTTQHARARGSLLTFVRVVLAQRHGRRQEADENADDAGEGERVRRDQCVVGWRVLRREVHVRLRAEGAARKGCLCLRRNPWRDAARTGRRGSGGGDDTRCLNCVFEWSDLRPHAEGTEPMRVAAHLAMLFVILVTIVQLVLWFVGRVLIARTSALVRAHAHLPARDPPRKRS